MRFIVLISILLASCGSTKRSTSISSVTLTDTVVHQQQKATDSTASQFRYLIERDSAVGISAKEVKDSLPSEHQNVRNSKGRKVPVHKEKTVNGLKAWINIDTSDNITYGASSDSMTLLVKGLIRERDSVVQRNRQFRFIDNVTKTSQTSNSSSSTTKTKTPALQWMLENSYWILPVLFVIFLVIRAVILSRNPFNKLK